MSAAHDICELSATELLALYASRELSPREAVVACLDRIDRVDPHVSAFVRVLADEAVERADAITADLGRGREVGPLAGVPVAIKDTEPLAGHPTSFGTVTLASVISRETGPQAARLLAAGAIIIGKTNTPAFAHSALTDNTLIGPTSTPFRSGYNAGGSSGGSAAAVAAGMVPLALGTDGGGSIRGPASMCGVLGVKPTFGALAFVDQSGATFGATAPFVHGGPLARTTADAALALDVLAGIDPRDPFSVPTFQAFSADPIEPLAGTRLALVIDGGGFPTEHNVCDRVSRAADELRVAGATVEVVDFDWGTGAHELASYWRRLAGLAQWMNLAEFKNAGYDFRGGLADEVGAELLQDVAAAEGVSAVSIKTDERIRMRAHLRLEAVLADYDAVLSPVVSVAGVPNGPNGRTTGPSRIRGVAVDQLIGWLHTCPTNLTGHPAASVPTGLTDSGLPVGIQITCRRFNDCGLLRLAATLEEVAPWRGTYGETHAVPTGQKK